MSRDINSALVDHAKLIAKKVNCENIKDITLSGSVSRGTASKYSDIEIDLWCDELPSTKEMVKVMNEVTENPVKLNEEDSDGSFNLTSTFNGVPVEFTWQTYANIEKLIDSVYNDLKIEHFTFVYFWTIRNQIHLVGSGRIEGIRERLGIYPEKLATKIIKNELEEYLQNPETRISDLERNELVSLNSKILNSIKSSLRYLYALNHEWEPYWKWITHTVDDELEIAPENLSERINSMILSMSAPDRALKESFQLYLDVLHLLAENETTVLKKLYRSKIELIEKYLKEL